MHQPRNAASETDCQAPPVEIIAHVKRAAAYELSFETRLPACHVEEAIQTDAVATPACGAFTTPSSFLSSRDKNQTQLLGVWIPVGLHPTVPTKDPLSDRGTVVK